ncbi:HD domain-containing phosphohydrolase [Marinomonas posidonica]|uniref:Response regulator receiver protein n=1 Tax=Marinomonas posidonica (strain CECT 7376 / NCIMB 14433 / IVIA-Po-181) TaxID=491952 RepID=F6CZX5_MARPP|nr:HD domain-containing phosphohydrolase [Marinomonas posidonica]AEF54715.1 response regulator receiver protein [Marinomonas posidonica IVIA-Po-181]
MSHENTEIESIREASTLLLVDDEQNVLSSLKRLFRKSNYTILTANSGQEGLDLLANHSVQVIISDARMPEMSGPEFLAIVAEQYPDTIRILLTGQADIESVIDAINRGKVSNYIQKPWDDDHIKELVSDAFNTVNLKSENENLHHLLAAKNKELIEKNKTLEATVKERTQKIVEINGALQENYKSTVDLFANLLDMRTPSPHPNTNIPNIITLVSDIAEVLKVPLREQVHLKRAAKMRYMSQVSFNDELLLTPYALLSDEQKEQYEQYPITGANLIKNIRPLVPVAEIILHHKEYLNGEGYPQGEKAENISLSARILTVVNDYIELRVGRMLENPLTNNEALDFLASKAGSHYDTSAVEALTSSLSLLKTTKPISDIGVDSKQLQTGMMLARDLTNSHGDILLPKGIELAESTIILLTKLEQNNDSDFQFFVDIPVGLEIPKTLLEQTQTS